MTCFCKLYDKVITFFTGINTFVRVTVDVFQSFTAVNCFFFDKHNDISCGVEYSQDCNTLIQKKRNGASINESDVTILLNDILPSTQYCFVLTAENQTHAVKLQGKFTGEMNRNFLTVTMTRRKFQ